MWTEIYCLTKCTVFIWICLHWVCSITICVQLVGHLVPPQLPPLWFLLDTQTSLATVSCLITMRRIAPPITVTQSDFHDPVGAACSQLSRNYSPCMYRKPSSAAQPFGSHIDGLTDSQWTHILTCGEICSMYDTKASIRADVYLQDMLCIVCMQKSIVFRPRCVGFTSECLHSPLTPQMSHFRVIQQSHSHTIAHRHTLISYIFITIL